MAAYLWRNIKLAAKSVFRNWREYLSFFSAVLILQVFFWLLTFSNYTNNQSALEVIEAAYSEHIIVENMNAAQSLSLHNDTVRYRILNEGIRSITFSDGGRTAKISFYDGNKEQSADSFVRKYVNKLTDLGEGHTVTLTPLLTYERDCRANNAVYWLLMLLLSAISVFLLMSLYYIRVNHFRFRYGIYMTFGADLKKLIGTSVWEMVTISLATAIPSGLLSALLTRLNYASVGVRAVFSVGCIFRVLLCNCAVVAVAVWLPMRLVSRQTPMSLIAAQNNANYASSPRVSSSILGKNSFPRLYELLSIVRFRKYYLKLLAVAVSFGALFICGLYVAQMNQMAEMRDVEEYSLHYVGSGDQEEIALSGEDMITSIALMDGVRYVDWTIETPAVNAASHILIKKQNRYFSGDYIVPFDKQDGYDFAFFALRYVASDALYFDMLQKSGRCEVEGDLSSVLTQPKTVAISENIYNERHIRFSVGDTILVAKALRTPAIPELADVSDATAILQKRMEKWTFSYEKYTVGAVIKNAESGAGITVCMNAEDYQTATGSSALRTDLSVYVENGAHPDALEAVFTKIVNLVNGYDGWALERHDAAFDALLVARKNNCAMILCIAMAILAISPVVWFFSQILFWRKRRGELQILRAFGAVEGEIRKLHLFSGLVMAISSFVLSLLMGSASNYLLYRFCNTVLPSLGLSSGIRYEYRLPAGALIFSAVLAVVCGFLSSMLPYYLDRAEEKKRAVSAGK